MARRRREAVRAALGDRDADVRQAAVHSAGLWRDAGALPQLVRALGSDQPAAQRAAAEALGRVGDAASGGGICWPSPRSPRSRAEHSVTYALIEIGDPAATAPDCRPRVARRNAPRSSPSTRWTAAD